MISDTNCLSRAIRGFENAKLGLARNLSMEWRLKVITVFTDELLCVCSKL